MPTINIWKILGSVEGGEALWLCTDEDIRARFPDTTSINQIQAMLEDKEIEVGEFIKCVPVSGWDGEVMAHFALPDATFLEPLLR